MSPSGSDSNDGISEVSPFKTLNKAKNSTQPGDTVYILDGVYRNSNYGNGLTSENGAAFYINVSGDETNGPITFKNYPGHSPKIQYDGSSGIGLASGVHHLVIEGLEIEGPAAAITYQMAIDNRIDNSTTGHASNYYNNRGIVGWGPHSARDHAS